MKKNNQQYVQDGVLAIPIPKPYPHPSYGRWTVYAEIVFGKKQRRESFKRIVKIGLFFLDKNFKREEHWIDANAEMLEMPFGSVSVKLGHEMGTGPYGGIYSLQHCGEHGGVVIALHPPDDANWVVAKAYSIISAEVQFHQEWPKKSL